MDASILKCMFSSAKLDYSTPQYVFEQLDAEFHFNLDACANEENHKVPNYYYGEEGLRRNWFCWKPVEERGRVFCNPPYGRKIGDWIEKGYEEFIRNNVDVLVFLLPSRTDTRWWHDYVMRAKEIRFIKGRLKFGGCGNSAPFPSCIVIFRS